MNADELIEILVMTRVWIFRTNFGGNDKFIIYESMKEEGDSVKKKVADFYIEDDAVAYLEAHRALVREYFKQRFKITVNYDYKGKLPKLADVKKYLLAQEKQNGPASNEPRN